MIFTHLSEINSQAFLQLKSFIKSDYFYLKIEGLNISGSIKIKTAKRILDEFISRKMITPDSIIICSSSGNLGVALSVLCRKEKLPFICVTDPNISEGNENLIKAYGGSVIKVSEKDKNGGYLATRINLIKSMMISNPNLIFADQYENFANPLAHYETTAPEIAQAFEHVDWLFIGAGTTGTLMGCSKYFKKISPNTQIVAVDADGSVTFGGQPKKRNIPGLGTSQKPAILQEKLIDHVILVSEVETLKMARFMLNERGLLFGGSTATVLAGVKKFEHKIKKDHTVVIISPDLGERYLNTIYSDQWITDKYGESVLKSIHSKENYHDAM